MDLETETNKPYTPSRKISDKICTVVGGIALGTVAGSWIEDAFNLVATAPIYDDLSTVTAILGGTATAIVMPTARISIIPESINRNPSLYDKTMDVIAAGGASAVIGNVFASSVEDYTNLVATLPQFDDTSLISAGAFALFGIGVRAYHLTRNNS